MFFVVLTSVLLQGTTIPLVAGWLGVRAPVARRRPMPLEFDAAARPGSDLAEIAVPEKSPLAGRRLVDVRLPRTALVVLIARGDDHVIPRGGTVIEAGDTLMVLADEEALNQVRTMVGASAGGGG